VAQRAGAQVVPLNRIPPHNLDAEQSVLGAMLESKEAIANVVEVVHSEDFYKPAHIEIYEAILALYGRGEQPDAITCAEELSRRGSLDRIGGKPYIYGLLEAYPTASSAGHYARIVEERALLRRLIDAGNKVQEIGFSIPENVAEGIDQAEELVYEVGNRRLRDAIQPIRKLLTENMEAIETLYERGENVTGLASGFPDLDEMTAGFQPSNLVIIAARPSMGKSSLIGDVALHAALHHREPVVIFSLEMSRHELVQRFLSSEARVDSQRIRRGSLQEQDWTRLSSALGRLAEAPIFIDDSANITLMEIRAKCRRLKAKFGLGLIIVDYLQLMQSPRKSENRQQEVSEISRALKILARELEVPVICASQLNRGVEYRSDKRPLLGDLRESGCLTGDALVTLGSGAQAPIAQLVGHQPQVMSLSPNWRIGIQQASKVWYTGHKPVFKLSTASGRTVRATGNHPFRMLGGWRALGDLRISDRIAIPRTYTDASTRSSEALESVRPNTNADTLPSEVWELVRSKMIASDVSQRRMAQLRGTVSGGTSHFSFSPSRAVLETYATALADQALHQLADSDLFWDVVTAIEADGTADVYDMSVPGTNNFIANGIVCHNSIEQDSDLVMFIYRDEVYNPETENRGEAELILAKHRNGPTGVVRLAFMNQYTKFASIAKGPSF
jgi:replicative DNA helicase